MSGAIATPGRRASALVVVLVSEVGPSRDRNKAERAAEQIEQLLDVAGAAEVEIDSADGFEPAPDLECPTFVDEGAIFKDAMVESVSVQADALLAEDLVGVQQADTPSVMRPDELGTAETAIFSARGIAA